MKKMNLLAPIITVAALFLCLCLFSCTRKGGGTESGVVDGGADTAQDAGGSNFASAKEKYEKLMTPTPRDGTAVKDGVVYGRYDDVSKGGVIANLGDRFSKLMYFVSSGGGEPILLCRDEDCGHSGISCHAVRMPGDRGEINVTSPDNKEQYFYYICFVDPTTELDGYSLGKFGLKGPCCLIFELDLRTGGRRTLAVNYGEAELCSYCDGVLNVAMTVGEGHREYQLPDGSTAALTDPYQLYYDYYDIIEIDVMTCREISRERCQNKIDYKDGIGSLADNIDFAKFERTSSYRLEFAEDGNEGKNLYLKNEGGYDVLIADGVFAMSEFDGDAYFSKYEDQLVETTVERDAGGTLYKYDGKTGEITAVFEDVGVRVKSINYVDNELVIFFGNRSDGQKNSETASGDAYFKYDRITNELLVLYEIGQDPPA